MDEMSHIRLLKMNVDEILRRLMILERRDSNQFDNSITINCASKTTVSSNQSEKFGG
jgi:hypothetical protein